MSALIDTLYNSFLSVGCQHCTDPKSSELMKPNTIHTEMELLKVMAPRHDLNIFTEELSKIKHNIGLNVEITVVIPNRRTERALEELEKHEWDFLDYIFSDTIPFLHDFLIQGSPEALFFQVKAEKKALDCFNDLCKQMIYAKELQCKLEVTDRRKLFSKKFIKNNVFGTDDCEPDLLDAIFTDDFSKSNPLLHNILVA